MEQTLCINSPVGMLSITASEQAVTALHFGGSAGSIPSATSPLLRQVVRELEEYFSGTRRVFSFALAPVGTPFQQKVWAALQTIPYGQRRSYRQIAEQIGQPTACRAVGGANNRNPIAIVIPCHRVVGHDGTLGGYAAGMAIKSRLLALERS